MDRKIVVPEGMLKAASDAYSYRGIPTQEVAAILWTALSWLSENPIVPTDEQTWEIFGGRPQQALSESIRLWIGRMFLAPDPEVPEAIKDMMLAGTVEMPAERFNECIIEAYRWGKAGG